MNNGPNSSEPTTFAFGEFLLDSAEGVLMRSGQRVPLQSKAIETLCVLVKRGGNVVTRDELIEEIWPDSFVEENNLSQHIRSLRKAFDGGKKGEVFIETIPRRGYRFLPAVGSADSKRPQSSDKPDKLSQRDSRIVGREDEIDEIKRLLLNDEFQILTLTGVGGTGKTTLAKAAAAEMDPHFANGVVTVELAAITDAELVASIIAQALNIKEAEGTSERDAIRNYLRDKEILLFIDNFEQVLPAAPLLAELAASSPALKLLVSSRAVLRLSCSREFVVPPLAFPHGSSRAIFEDVRRADSVRLFVDRARAVKPGFELNESNAQIVADICSRLDGLPLAIELAAARIKVIPVRMILDRLDHRLDLLTGGANDLPARQQTMRNAIEWSHELLSGDEQVLFRRLAVFSGGFTFEAAEAIAGRSTKVSKKNSKLSGGGRNVPEACIDILEGMTSLLDNSLIIQAESGGEARFRMLEVVREFAFEMLIAAGESGDLSRAHSAHFLELSEEAEIHLQGAASVKWLNELEDEHDNLRAALRWSVQNE
ncbi:MAG: winged helix-turn-helix domain-containing protein, partial [Pyrinomonadaceae bacterium]